VTQQSSIFQTDKPVDARASGVSSGFSVIALSPSALVAIINGLDHARIVDTR
jgi:hypothetical protein